MGAQQSKASQPTVHEKAVIKRLRNLQVEENTDGYVEITSDAEKMSFGPLIWKAEDLPVEMLESWKTSFLKDPKNRCVPRGPAHMYLPCVTPAIANTKSPGSP